MQVETLIENYSQTVTDLNKFADDALKEFLERPSNIHKRSVVERCDAMVTVYKRVIADLQELNNETVKE